MEGVQKCEGGGCGVGEGLRWATLSMLQQAPSEASHRHSVDSNPATHYSPEKKNEIKNTNPKKTKPNQKTTGKRRWEENAWGDAANGALYVL